MSRKSLAMPFIQVQLNLNWEDAYAVPYVGPLSAGNHCSIKWKLQFEAQKRPYNKDFCDSWPELLSWLWLATEQRVRTRVACALSRRSYHWVTMTARSELRLPLTLLRRRQTTWKGQEGHRCRPGWCRPKGKLNPPFVHLRQSKVSSPRRNILLYINAYLMYVFADIVNFHSLLKFYSTLSS